LAVSAKSMGQRRVHAVANQPPHARRVVALPRRVDRQPDVGRPSRHGAGRREDRVAHRFVPPATPVEHFCKHPDVEIGIVVDPDLALAVVQAMQAADILCNGSPPRHRQREKECIKPRVVKTFSDVSPGRQPNALLIGWSPIDR
jgi:hypothetical protein